MDKPTLKERKPVMDYHDMIDYIEKKYNITVRDYNRTFESSRDFTKETGLNVFLCPDISGKYKPEWQSPGYEGWTIIEGGLRSGSKKRIKATEQEYKEQFQEYYDICSEFKQWKIKNNISEVYLDYWHWLLDKQFYDVNNGSTEYWNIKGILDDKDTPEWVYTITKYVYDEFKDNLDKDGGIEVLIEW
jgi:hypothetical protein